MIDKVEHIEVDGKKYPYFFDLNMLEQIQDEYGSIAEWDKKLTGKEGEDGNKEWSCKHVKKSFASMINEGYAKEGSSETIDEKQVGAIFAKAGLREIGSIVQRQVTECIYGKNFLAALEEIQAQAAKEKATKNTAK